MRQLFRFVLFILTVHLFTACSVSRLVVPLKQKQAAIQASAGGPMLKVDNIPVIMPLSSIGMAYGAAEDFSVFANVHTTSAFYGNLQVDVGGLYQVVYNEFGKYGMSVAPIVNMITHFEEDFKVYPQLDVHVYQFIRGGGGWACDCPGGKKRSKIMLYGGVSNWWELASERSNGQNIEKKWAINPHLGVSFYYPKWNFQIETKAVGVNMPNDGGSVEYVSFMKQKGAIGVYLGMTRKIGRF